MRALVSIVISFLVCAVALVLTPVEASAEPCAKAKLSGNCVVKATKKKVTQSTTVASGGGRSSGPSPEQQLAAYQRATKKYYSQLNSYQDCLSAGSASCDAPAVVPELEGALGVITATPGGPPLMSPGQAGAIAVARLQLPLNAPAVGPDPSVNKWKMAAVGYPLWVWADGPTHIGPVSDSVAGLSVSLDAQLTKTVFRMGDGQTVTCRDGGTPYRKGTAAGTPSPDCGYRYENPSLPKGDYTVTAIGYWAVTWTINGTSGVITVPRAASAPLPVGEVQVLVR
jgi:hypothetical protein